MEQHHKRLTMIQSSSQQHKMKNTKDHLTEGHSGPSLPLTFFLWVNHSVYGSVSLMYIAPCLQNKFIMNIKWKTIYGSMLESIKGKRKATYERKCSERKKLPKQTKYKGLCEKNRKTILSFVANKLTFFPL